MNYFSDKQINAYTGTGTDTGTRTGMNAMYVKRVESGNIGRLQEHSYSCDLVTSFSHSLKYV